MERAVSLIDGEEDLSSTSEQKTQLRKVPRYEPTNG